MSNTLSKVIIFAAGAAVGSLVTWKLVEKKYKQLADQEINSVLERFVENKEETIEKTEEEKDDEEDESTYKRFVKKCGYLYDDESEEEMEEDEEMGVDRPYVISPDEFDENGYRTMTLFYYNNGILVDEKSNIIDGDELDDLIGYDALNHFGDYEDDSVFVRNDAMKLDIEILKDEDDYEVR